jgi:hypothetical protein
VLHKRVFGSGLVVPGEHTGDMRSRRQWLPSAIARYGVQRRHPHVLQRPMYRRMRRRRGDMWQRQLLQRWNVCNSEPDDLPKWKRGMF